MDYKKVSFRFEGVEEYQKDILIGQLADVGFDSFVDEQGGFDAFVIATELNGQALADVVAGLDFQCEYNIEDVAPQNWNEEWEKNFSPLIISDECYVRATFHEAQPQYQYEIVIDPKMSFGTGHHQTTTMMMQYILEEDFIGKEVLDMGAGTAILGILTARKGAKSVVAIDYDEICYESAIENAKLNNIDNLVSLHGSKEVIPQQSFDVILANINRNILLDQIERYSLALVAGGAIFYSGFYETPDLDMIKAENEKYDLSYVSHKKINDWVAAKFVKK